MKSALFIVVLCMIVSAILPIQKAYGEELKGYTPVKVKGWVVASPCERHLSEGEGCIEIYLSPRATIDVFKASRYDDRELEYRRVDTVRIPNEETHNGQRDQFELSLVPGHYFFTIHNGWNGQTVTLGPIDVFISNKTAELVITMYNNAGGKPSYDISSPREICMEYELSVLPMEPKLLPETFCSTIEPHILP